MRDAVAKLYTPWKDRKHKPKRRHKNFDESIGNAERISDARPDDVLFGRGRAYQNHPGNKRMRAIVFKYKPEYDKVHRSRKRDVVEAAYSEITELGARFLYKARDEEDSYAIVNMPTALQKVRNTLGAKLSAKDQANLQRELMEHNASLEAAKRAKKQAPSALHLTKNAPIDHSKLLGKVAAVPSKKDSPEVTGLLRQHQAPPTSLLGLSASSGILDPLTAAATEGMLARQSYFRSLAAEAALLDPTALTNPLLLGRLNPATLPLSLMDPLAYRPSLLGTLEEQQLQRHQQLFAQEALLARAGIGGAGGLTPAPARSSSPSSPNSNLFR